MPLTPRNVRQLVKQQALLTKLGISPFIDWSMTWWRSLILDRPGFAVRFALTENAGRLLRTGPRKFAASYLANGAARTMTDEQIAEKVGKMLLDGEIQPSDAASEMAAQRAQSIKPVTPYHPIERSLEMLAERAPEGLRPHIETLAQLYGGVMGGTARRWARAAQVAGLKALDLEHYVEAATHLATHQPVAADAFDEMLSAARGGGDRFIYTPEAHLNAIENDGKGVMASMRKTGKWSTDDPTAPLFAFKWQSALDQIAQSKLGRAVLESISLSPREQRQSVLRVLNDPSFAETKARFERSRFLPDGRIVGVDATKREADQAFARTVVAHVHSLVRAGDPKNGEILHDLIGQMLATGSGPTNDAMAEVLRAGKIPEQVYGPDLLQVHKFRSLFDKSWDVLVGRPANWLARQPQFIQAYADALAEVRPFAHQVAGVGDSGEKLASDLAVQRAVKAVIPFIHNPELRTQFEDYHRNLFPFLFAQRQFLQRWARTIKDSPDAIRKLQLTLRGMTTSGIVHRDTNGNDYFYYPGSQYVQELLSHGLNAIGLHTSIPMVTPFTGQVQYLIPGLDNPVTPSVGPFAAIGMKELAKLYPEMNGFNQTVLNQGAGTPMWQDLVPSVLSRLYTALGPNETGSQLGSTTMQAIKYMYATGHGMPANPTPAEQEQFVRRVTNWARTLLVTRAGLGFVLPSTPTATTDHLGWGKEWRQLLNDLPYTTAVAEMVRQHPTAVPYTKSESETAMAGFTPATKGSFEWMNQHQAFVKAYPHAAAWFIPRTTGAYTAAAYREQIALGLRTPLSVSSNLGPQDRNFLDTVAMARASDTYYKGLDNFNAAYNRPTATHQSLAHEWDTWKASFLKRNPMFHEYLTSQQGTVHRQETITTVERALASTTIPATPQTEHMRTMLKGYTNFTDAFNQYAGATTYSSYAVKKTMKTEMLNWGKAYIAKHPTVADFWNTVLRYQVEMAK